MPKKLLILVCTILIAVSPCTAQGLTGEFHWGTAELFETGNGYTESVSISTDGSGNTVAVWTLVNGIPPWNTRNSSICSNRYVVGTGWGRTELIEALNGDADSPHVSTDISGNAVAVWTQDDGTAPSIWFNRYVVGDGWGTAELIETGNGDASYPIVSADRSGNALSVWLQSNGIGINGRDSIWSNRYVAGAGWGTAVPIETDSGQTIGLQLATDSNGNALAVWLQFDGAKYSLRSNRYLVGVGWGTAEFVPTDNVVVANPQISSDRNGNFIAIWSQSDRPPGIHRHLWKTWSSRYLAGTGWTSAEPIQSESRGKGHPQVSSDSSGNAVAVWDQFGETRDGIWSNRYVVGVGWGTAELIDSGSGKDSWYPIVSADDGGNAVVVWHQRDKYRDPFRIWSNRYTVGSGWGTAQLIDTGGGYARNSSISLDSNGNVMVVWHQYEFDGEDGSIWSNRLSYDGDPLGNH